MLVPITGRARSGKSARLYNMIDRKGAAGQPCILIVPEQFSFEAEKLVLQKTSAQAAANTEVMSFSRMAEKLTEKYDPGHAPYVTARGRLLIMNLVLDDLWDRLSVYGRVKNRRKLAAEMLAADTELKQACLSPDALLEIPLDEDNASLSHKLADLGLILGAYNAALQGKCSDKASALLHLCELLDAHDDYRACTVAVDEFSGFTADELAVLERLIEYCPEVYITFCLDGENAPGADAFSLPRKSYADVTALAKKNHIAVRAPLRCEASFYDSAALAHSETFLFAAAPERYAGAADDICVCKCENRAEECEFAAAVAKKLIYEQGYRCRDIAVIERGQGAYAADVVSAFSRYGVSVFRDTRRSILWEPAAAYILAFAENALKGMSTDAVLRMLRSGMSDFADADIDLLDQYLLAFDIDGAEWKREWRYNPKGFGAETDDESLALLEKLNALRASLVESFSSFAAETAGKTCGETARALYDRMICAGVPEKTRRTASFMAADGKNDEADTVIAAYNELIACFSDIYEMIGDRTLDGKRFFELFAESVGASTAGVAPQGIDEVTVGSADRIRLGEKKAVIVVGVNEDAFPAPPSASGIFSDSERRLMSALGADISGDTDFLAQRERYICYRTFASASSRLYVTYSKKDASGKRLEPSEIVANMRRILSDAAFTAFSALAPVDRIAGKEAAFRYLASHYLSADGFLTALLAYFKNAGDTARVDALDRLARKTAPAFADAANAERLYGRHMMISPSRLDTYYTCAFRYFCRYGMRAEPRMRAELTASQNGLAVHYVLQRVFDAYGSRGIVALSDAEKLAAVEAYTEEYIAAYMPGLADKSQRMREIIRSYTEVIYMVLRRLAEEFADSEFVTCDTELSIGRPGARDGIDAYFVPDGVGGSVGVRGTVDRVDMLRRGDTAYLRVVDYKTGSKKFCLGEVAEGLNMQMLIYLMALWKHGKARYRADILPAGVLYIPAEIGKIELSREDDGGKQNRKNGKMNGLLLDDAASLRAMGADKKESFVPAHIGEDGATGSVISLRQFENLHKLIDQKIAQMGAGLKRGNIAPYPIETENTGGVCRYCAYRAVCLREESDAVRAVVTLTDDAMRERLSEKDGEAHG